MQKSYIDISHSDFYPKIIYDYLKGNEKLKPFYRYPPSISSFQKVIDDFNNIKYNRKLLVDVLIEQYANIKFPISNIQLLSEANTFTVCTGHQLCLFTGPLYFIYKIFSTINLAEELKKNFSEYNFVPVFWMASEDHDFEEINHIHLFGKKIEWQNKQGGPIGEYENSGIEEIIKQLKNILGESENSNKLLKLFFDSYLKNKNLADATRFLINELFGEYGLIIIDGNDKRLKKEFSEIIADEIVNNTSHKLVNETNRELNNLSYKTQVNPREINLFYLKKNERTKIEIPAGHQYAASLVNEIERFSPNVVLRTLYQQKILPNVAYIGGPNELAYWFQFKKMFEHYKINFPVLILRNSILWIDEKSSSLMKKFGINEEEIFENIESLINKFISKTSSGNSNLDTETEKIKSIFALISTKAGNVDPTLKPAAEAELQRVLNSLQHLEKKMLKAEKHKNEVVINQIRKIKEKLFPENNLQERYENFIPYYLIYGDEFLKILKENIKSFDNRMLIFRNK